MNYSKKSLLFVVFLLCFMFVFVKATETVLSSNDCNGDTKDKDKCSKGITRLALPYINPIKVGYEQTVQLSEEKTLTMRTLSLAPPIFEIPNFFSPDECELVIEMATKKGMADSPVLKDKRKFVNDTTQEVFNHWDNNNDGFVEADEMLMLRGNSDLYLTEDDIKKMFQELAIDKDNDGKMNFEEFKEVTADAIKMFFDQFRQTQTPHRSRHSQQAWLWHDEDELLKYEGLFEDYHERIAKITKLPSKLIEDSEPLQVVHYKEKGHYHCHHDSEVINTELPCCVYGMKNCRFCRYLTLTVFLNDVESGGELAFPVADNSTYKWEVWTKDYTKCNMVKHCSNSNVIVKPKAGTAIVFYNHLYDKSSQWSSALDPRSLVGECQVQKGDKWIAHTWMNVVGDGITELKSWKTGTNWLSQKNLNKEVISSLEANYQPDEEIDENRYTREKNSLGDASSDSIEGPPKIENENEVEISTQHYDALEGINMNEVKKEYLPKPQDTEPASSTPQEQHPNKKEELLPKGPEVHLGSTPAPLPLPLETMTLKEPTKPPMDSDPIPPVEGHRVLKSIMLLIDELDQVELEILARNLHSRLKLVCVPLMINPMGGLH